MKRLESISIESGLGAYIVRRGARVIFDGLALLDSILHMKVWCAALVLCVGGALAVGCASETTVPVAEGIFAELGLPLPFGHARTDRGIRARAGGRPSPIHPGGRPWTGVQSDVLRRLPREARLWWRREPLSQLPARRRRACSRHRRAARQERSATTVLSRLGARVFGSAHESQRDSKPDRIFWRGAAVGDSRCRDS